jgi:four helix bundle protein
MKVQKFEDLIAWQKARELTRQVYMITRKEPFCKDFSLCNQMQRSSVSIMSNLAEGFERGSSKEFHQFLVIAKASCAELRSQLYVASDIGYITRDMFEQIHSTASEVSRIIGGLKTSIQKKK